MLMVTFTAVLLVVVLSFSFYQLPEPVDRILEFSLIWTPFDLVILSDKGDPVKPSFKFIELAGLVDDFRIQAMDRSVPAKAHVYVMCLLLLTKVADDVGHHHVEVESRLFAEAHERIAKYRLHATIVDAVIDVVALGVFIVGVLYWIAVGLLLFVCLSLF